MTFEYGAFRSQVERTGVECDMHLLGIDSYPRPIRFRAAASEVADDFRDALWIERRKEPVAASARFRLKWLGDGKRTRHETNDENRSVRRYRQISSWRLG